MTGSHAETRSGSTILLQILGNDCPVLLETTLQWLVAQKPGRKFCFEVWFFQLNARRRRRPNPDFEFEAAGGFYAQEGIVWCP